MAVAANKELVRRWGCVWQAGNLHLVDELASPDIIVRYPLFTQDMIGRDPLKRLVTSILESFPDVQFTFEELIAEGDNVVGRWRARGTSQGAFAGYPATGKQVEWTGISIYRIVAGKVVEDRGEEDIFGLFRQLGATVASASVNQG